MALVDIEHGSKASSQLLNDNFHYLQDLVGELSIKIDGSEATVDSKIATSRNSLQSEISALETEVNSSIAELQADIDVVNNNADKKLTATISKSANGYCKFSNGLIIQWGSTGVTKNKTITLPTPFNNTDYKVALIEIGGNIGWTRAAINVSIVSKTQWKIARVDSCEHHYIAIGY